jgi:hypothetical protein
MIVQFNGKSPSEPPFLTQGMKMFHQEPSPLSLKVVLFLHFKKSAPVKNRKSGAGFEFRIVRMMMWGEALMITLVLETLGHTWQNKHNKYILNIHKCVFLLMYALIAVRVYSCVFLWVSRNQVSPVLVISLKGKGFALIYLVYILNLVFFFCFNKTLLY